jgi:hypothetical protein
MTQTAADPKYLVPPSTKWRGTLGQRLTIQEFAAYVQPMLLGPAFKPRFIVIHNTATPNHSQWASHDVVDREKNMTADYRDRQKWAGGPHLFVDWTGIWLFTPLWKQGTHSPSWNKDAWGIEMVGDYAKESFTEGDGGKVRILAATATAILLRKLKLQANNTTVRLHKEDPATNHDCPGKNVSKPDFLGLVNGMLNAMH